MFTPAYFEDSMKDYENKINNIKSGKIVSRPEDVPILKQKAVKDVVFVLKQYGYDAGANIFERIMSE